MHYIEKTLKNHSKDDNIDFFQLYLSLKNGEEFRFNSNNYSFTFIRENEIRTILEINLFGSGWVETRYIPVSSIVTWKIYSQFKE